MYNASWYMGSIVCKLLYAFVSLNDLSLVRHTTRSGLDVFRSI